MSALPGGDSAERYFADLYGANDDPYQVHTRWYESRKQAIVLASLARPRYARAFEPACGAGALTLALAGRCDALLASDFSADAVRVTRQHTAHLPHVQVQTHRLPQDWPHAQGPFDLIVLSEWGYFMSAADWAAVAQACAASLGEDGELLACDWRPDFALRRQSTEAVQSTLQALQLHRVCHHDEADFVLQIWSRDGRSVAQRGGIRDEGHATG